MELKKEITTDQELKRRNVIYQKEYKKRAYNERPWLRYLHSANSRCHNKSNRYTQRGIQMLLSEKDIKQLWFRDKAWLLKRPSIDRINGNFNYFFDNCRFIELSENYRQRTVHNTPKERPWKRKPVLQFDLKGNFIKEWPSIKTAQASIVKGGVYNCVEKYAETAGGYIWKLKH